MNQNFKFEYTKNGYYIFRDVLNRTELKKCRNALIKIYNQELDKRIDDKNFDKLISKHEQKKNWDKMYLAFSKINMSQPFVKIVKRLKSFTKKNFQIQTKKITSAYAIGIKGSTRTNYEWHQEKSYYPNHDIINYQFAFLRSLNKNNGTMSVLEGSHLLGKISKLNYMRKHKKSTYSYVPKEIKKIKNYYKEKFIKLNVGDVCVFHENILHKSNINKTNKVRFAGVVRLVYKKRKQDLI